MAYARAAEACGFSGVWLAEHHFIRYGSIAAPLVLAAEILRATSLHVGTAACVLSTRHPVALAEEAGLLEALHDGRFRLGVARGGPWVDLEVFGTGLARYARGFAEALDLLLATRAGTVAAAGEFFSFREVPVPAPYTGPVWVAATSPGTVALAAARGLPLLLGVHEDDKSRLALLDHYRDCGGPGDAPHAAAYLAHAGDPGALRGPLREWLATTEDYVRLVPGSGRDLDSYVERLLAVSPVGTPTECAEKLRVSAAVTRVTHQLLMVEGAGSPEAVLANIEKLGHALARDF